MAVKERGDPRLQQLFGAGAAPGVKPVVRLPRSGPPGWMIAVVAGLAALLLFWILVSRPTVQSVPEVRERGPGAVLFSPEPPPLYIPAAPTPEPQIVPVTAESEPRPAVDAEPRSRPARAPQFVQQPMPQSLPVTRAPQRRPSSGPALVIDVNAPPAPPQGWRGDAPGSRVQSEWGGRARAGSLANRSNTVAQGAIIPAVLETAFNSTGAGLVRAIVSRDVRGFDGTKVLIPRGSRLIGEYRAEIAPGQKRAIISWTRLLRPDGVTISLDSPATDTLGRAGVRASVDSHFWDRLGNTLLRTTLDVGAGIATRAVSGPLVFLPGSGGAAPDPAYEKPIVPTLSIPAGTSVTVFVARDLEFPDRGSAE